MSRALFMVWRETLRDVVVPIVVAGLAAFAVVKAAEIASEPPAPAEEPPSSS